MKKRKKRKRRKMEEKDLIEKFRLLYEQDQKAYQACVAKYGARPEVKGGETVEQQQIIQQAALSWDYLFEHFEIN